MKNLKSYKLFEALGEEETIPKNLIEGILDISTDLTDDGFNIQYKTGGVIYPYPCIMIHKMEDSVFNADWGKFTYSDIKGFVKTIQSYLAEEGYNMGVSYRNHQNMMESIWVSQNRGHHQDENKICSSLFRIDIIDPSQNNT